MGEGFSVILVGLRQVVVGQSFDAAGVVDLKNLLGDADVGSDSSGTTRSFANFRVSELSR